MSQTPLMAQYNSVKQNYADAVLLFQMGDFFESFGEDAIILSKVLDIVLTSRDKKNDAPPMAGFPIKALDDHLPKLVAAGHKVAIARQMELPTAGKGIVRREVTEVITQGTIATQTHLLSDEKNYLAAVLIDKNVVGIAFCDITTGELNIYENQYNPESFLLILEKINPREIIVPVGFSLPQSQNTHFVVQSVDKNSFSTADAQKELLTHFKTYNTDSLGLTEKSLALRCAGAIIAYVRSTKKTDPHHITTITTWNPRNNLIIDFTTQRNLEFFYNSRSFKKDGSLIAIIDRTKTAMGHRLLYDWLNFPLQDTKELNLRFDTIDFFKADHSLLQKVAEELKSVCDIERITSLIGFTKVHPKKLLQLASSIQSVLTMNTSIKNLPEYLKSELKNANMDVLKDFVQNVTKSLATSESSNTNGIFQNGYNTELDELFSLARHGDKLIKEIFVREREKSGITSLKIGFNNVFGYYFETSHANEKNIPAHFIKKQTLVNNDRYITEEVKALEGKVLSAQSNLEQLEAKLYTEYVTSLQKYIPELKHIGKFTAYLDLLSAFATLASERNYTRPEFIDDSVAEELIDARHPVVETTVKDFIPNSFEIAPNQNFIILTGPNMGGKSTFVRQIALIHTLAQIGCFVPATTAKLHILDRIFARIGASDDISTGRSTFMVELSEVAYILSNATERSLIILDEVGRGTSTYEGISLAWAISEHIIKNIKAKTIFTTHFREITELEKRYTKAANYKINLLEKEQTIYFLHTISRGISDKSYGIHVARLVKLPDSIIQKASELLEVFEKKTLKTKSLVPEIDSQLSLLAEPTVSNSNTTKVFQKLKEVSIDSLTPLQALQLLSDLKKELE